MVRLISLVITVLLCSTAACSDGVPEVDLVRALANGVEIEFAEPVPALGDAARYEVWTCGEKPSAKTIGPWPDARRLWPHVALASADQRRVFLELPPIERGRAVGVRLVIGDRVADVWYVVDEGATDAGPTFTPLPAHSGARSAPPPAGADVLFGNGDTAWRHANGTDASWPVRNGAMLVDLGAGDILSRAEYDDVQLHVEWMAPSGGAGQRAGNSGVKILERYELQILGDPAGAEPEPRNAGAIYGQYAAAHGVGTGPETWQSFDIWFTAPRWNGAEKIANARMTVYWNGQLVHDDVELPDKTGASVAEAPGVHPILLQAHGSDSPDPVQFRNVWTVRPPAAPRYPDDITLTMGQPVSITPREPAAPVSAGLRFLASPPLPAGLVLDGRTGSITGSPIGAGRSSHEITAVNSAGSRRSGITIVVKPRI